jgi:RHS repeat-associated protein
VETGLDYMHARYCSSAQGRFTSPDTMLGSIGSPQSLNRYAYVGNNPLTYADPTGHDRFDAASNGFGEAMADEGQGGYMYPENPDFDLDSILTENERQGMAAFDERVQNQWDADKANAALQSGDLDTVNQLLAGNSSLRSVDAAGNEFTGALVNVEVTVPQNPEIQVDKVELLDSAGAGYPVGPLGVPRPANVVETGTKMEQAPSPNTYKLIVDADKIDPNEVLAVRVTFHSGKGLELDPRLISVSTGEGRLRWNLLQEYVGQPAIQRDYGQVTFRVKAGYLEAPTNSIEVKVGARRQPRLLDINNPNFRPIEYETFRIRLYREN